MNLTGNYFCVNPQTGQLLAPTLTQSAPLDSNLVGLDQVTLDDLGAGVGPTWSGQARWPENSVTPAYYDPTTQSLGPLGTPTVDTVNKVVNTTYAVVALTTAQIKAIALASAQATYNNALSAGLTIISTANIPSMASPGVTVAVNDSGQAKCTAEQVSILTRGLFTNGQTSRGWLDVNLGAHIVPNIAAGTELVEAIGWYVDALITALATAQAGGMPSWPNATITIG